MLRTAPIWFALAPLAHAEEGDLSIFDTAPRFESFYPDQIRGVSGFPWNRTTSDLISEEIRYFAARYALMDDIPYVWGGGTAARAPKDACVACKACIAGGQIGQRQVYHECRACQKCGIDCSHLVAQILEQAGMRVPYGSTEELLGRSPDLLRRAYRLTAIPAHAGNARPGDLLVFRGHVVMLLQNHGNGTATIVHSAAFRAGSPFGGISIETIDLGSYAGGVKRILRHNVLVGFTDEIEIFDGFPDLATNSVQQAL